MTGFPLDPVSAARLAELVGQDSGSGLIIAAGAVATALAGVGAAVAAVPRVRHAVVGRLGGVTAADLVGFRGWDPERRAIVIDHVRNGTHYAVTLRMRPSNRVAESDVRAEQMFQATASTVRALAKLGGGIEIRLWLEKRPSTLGLDGSEWAAFGAAGELMAKYCGVLAQPFVTEAHLCISVPARRVGVLNQAVQTVISGLADFWPEVLTQRRERVRVDGRTIAHSALWTHWTRLLNPVGGRYGPVEPRDPAAAVIVDGRNFRDAASDDSALIRFSFADERKYAAVLKITDLENAVATGTMSAIRGVPAHILECHHFIPWDSGVAESLVARKKAETIEYNWPNAHGAGIREQFSAATSKLAPGSEFASSLSHYSCTILVYGATPAEATSHTVSVQTAARRMNKVVSPLGVGDQRAMEAAYWTALVPGHREMIVAQDLFSEEIARLIEMDAPSVGMDQCRWGKGAVLPVLQPGGSVYRFHMHANDGPEAAGHTIVFGSTGSGKSLFVSLIMLSTLRWPSVRWLRFDRDMGAYPFTLGLGRHGRFVVPRGDDGSGGAVGADGVVGLSMNPCQLDLGVDSNVQFLREWLRLRARDIAPDDTQLSAAELDEAITDVIKSLLLTPMRERSLASVVRSALGRDSAAAEALGVWADRQGLGGLWNGQDTFALGTDDRVISVDVTDLLRSGSDGRASPQAAAAVDYISYRVFQQQAQSPIGGNAFNDLGIFVDELEQMARASPEFARAFIKRIALEGRRAGIALVAAIQRSSALVELGLEDLVRENFPTKVYLRNPNARRDDWPDLTDTQFNIMTGRHPEVRDLRYYALVVRTGEVIDSTIMRLDLSMVGEHLRLLRGDRKAINAMRAVREGFSQEDYVRQYLATRQLGGVDDDDLD